MPLMKIGRPKLDKNFFEGWFFVLVAGIVLAIVAVFDSGGSLGLSTTSTADGSSGCQLEVTTDRLNVRGAPSQDGPLVRTLARGDRVDGTRIQTNFYRQLEDGGWAATEFMTPVPGSDCG